MTNAEIQAALNATGFGPVATDGIIGPRTTEAIKRFQRANSLMPDGIPGTKTQAALAAKTGAAVTPVATNSPIATGGFPMQFSDRGMAMLALSEAVKTKAYYDTAKPPVLTIGIGATMASKIFRDWWFANKPNEAFTINSTITKSQAYDVTRQMVSQEYGDAVNDFLGKAIPQPQFDAAVHFVYNAGVHSLAWNWALPFKAGDYKSAAEMIRTRYLKPPELKERREHEALLMGQSIYRTI